MQGWFHGHGVFWRADGMKFEGEFRGGRIWGLGKRIKYVIEILIVFRYLKCMICAGLVTFSDNSNGFPRNEGFFQDCRLVRKKKCSEIIQRAQKVAYMARAQCQQL